jgi:hypothetical protein
MIAAGTTTVGLVPGDTLRLAYAKVEEGSSDVQPCFMVLGVGSGSSEPLRRLPNAAEPPEVPMVFRLGQNQPNPFTRTTRIPFELPASVPVRLEVFDLLGRRVATVANGVYPAGYHSATWDMRDGHGASARPGIYVYRIVAGSFREERKLALLP